MTTLARRKPARPPTRVWSLPSHDHDADLDAFLVSPQHAGKAVGTVRADGFTPASGVPVTDGVFNLFVNSEEFYQRRMLLCSSFHRE